MSLEIRAVRDALQSHAMVCGLFERVDGHESLNAPGRGLSAQVILGPGPILGVAKGSGLPITSARTEFTVRLMASLNREPADDIDVDLGEAADTLMAAYNGGFQLGGTERHIDLLASHGQPMRAQPGYLDHQDGTVYRLLDVIVPVIIYDVWEQVP